MADTTTSSTAPTPTTPSPSTAGTGVNSNKTTSTTDEVFNLENLLRISEVSPSFRDFLSQLASESDFLAHVNNHVVHVEPQERAYWNSIEKLADQYTQNSFDTIVGYNPKTDDPTGKNRTFYQKYKDDMQAFQDKVEKELADMKKQLEAELKNFEDQVNNRLAQMNQHIDNLQASLSKMAYTGRTADAVDYNSLVNNYIIHANHSDTSTMTYNIPQGNQGGNIWID